MTKASAMPLLCGERYGVRHGIIPKSPAKARVFACAVAAAIVAEPFCRVRQLRALAKSFEPGLYHDDTHEFTADAGGVGRKGNRLAVAASGAEGHTHFLIIDVADLEAIRAVELIASLYSDGDRMHAHRWRAPDSPR